MTELLVRRLDATAALPVRVHSEDAGLDLAAAEARVLQPGERATVGTGVAVAIPSGHAGLVVPRSGLAAMHGITIVNSPGVIDPGYRGEIKVVLLNTDLRVPFGVERGMRIAQLVVVAVAALPVLEVDELPEGERASAGFGSTGAR